MNVTQEQLAALERGEPVPVAVDQEPKACVLLLREKYEEMKRLLEEAEEVDPSFFECEEIED